MIKDMIQKIESGESALPGMEEKYGISKLNGLRRNGDENGVGRRGRTWPDGHYTESKRDLQ